MLHEYRELSISSGKLIVVTLGAKGSYAFNKGESIFQPALKVDKVVDTTGCGDAYQAAFSVTFFKTNDIRQSMNAGAVAASKVLQTWGGAGNNW